MNLGRYPRCSGPPVSYQTFSSSRTQYLNANVSLSGACAVLTACVHGPICVGFVQGRVQRPISYPSNLFNWNACPGKAILKKH